ncbi:hypothetical protein COCCADRAFT_83253 [Bipolaris zeicola 26-R-13]|uniref:Uncharacterized protein n=1 Tax=Cochliobolus carbonum (strain 26-R-13) TaxID=930089 RepID=W6YFP3_COCC2|nr:uncharacterized protein COCCADRAFT_83253 [Bipolaris zeicola 26-R-13]EUC38297.1 hypothetical protein COCCADRAFT_83253 [Bipolaris zeicola 26-R-13]
MKYTTTTLSLLITLALASAPTDPQRILPPNWSFTLSSFFGPGCPDTSKNTSSSSTIRTTRPTHGTNTIDFSEIYYWFIAYPWLRVDLASGPRHTWCEATVSYKEFADTEGKAEAERYRLRVHKNGTKGLLTYRLDEGVRVYWDFAYYEGRAFGGGRYGVADTIDLTGPLQSGPHAQEHYSNISYPPQLIPQKKCGSGLFTFRTELWVVGEKGQVGVVESEYEDSVELGRQYYGTQQGFSYDLEKCE